VSTVGGSAAAPGAPELVWVNGAPAASVSALERGLHYGDGLFETIACVHGEPRFLELHLWRLAAGCARLGLPATQPTLAAEVRTLAAGSARAIVKVLLTRGPAQARGYALTGHEQASRIVLRYGWPAEDATLERDGVRVRLAEQRLGENPALAGLKHLNRLEQVLARREWSDAQIADALMFSSSGALVSGTMSNVFLVRNGTLCTPSVERCGVAGVMRRVVRALAAQASQVVEERVLEASDLETTTEMFLTNALIGIRPVRELAGRSLQPGRLTRQLQDTLAPWLARARELPGELAHD
jgi:4-amino-4-deoxychorismate lyase